MEIYITCWQMYFLSVENVFGDVILKIYRFPQARHNSGIFFQMSCWSLSVKIIYYFMFCFIFIEEGVF